MSPAAVARSAALVRILAGIIFVAEGWAKVSGDFVRGGFAGSVAETVSGPSWPAWKTFLERVVAPNATVFGWVFAGAELLLGIALVLGLWTRAAAVGGSLLMAILLLGQTYVPGKRWDEWVTAGLTAKFALLLLLLLALADAGRVWGLDGRLAGRRGSVRRR
jgi:uncharacterized membrane protein YphA (DoxX/SURF4 family)